MLLLNLKPVIRFQFYELSYQTKPLLLRQSIIALTKRKNYTYLCLFRVFLVNCILTMKLTLTFLVCFLKIYIYIFYVFKYTVTVFRHTRRGCQISLRAVVSLIYMCLLGFELRTYRRAVSALTCCAISPALLLSF